MKDKLCLLPTTVLRMRLSLLKDLGISDHLLHRKIYTLSLIGINNFYFFLLNTSQNDKYMIIFKNKLSCIEYLLSTQIGLKVGK